MTKNNEKEQLVMFQDLFSKSDFGLENEERKKAFEKGYAKSQLDMKEKFILLEKISKRLVEEKQSLLERMKPEIIDFCLLLTEQLIRQQFTDPTVLMNMVHSLIEAIGKERAPLSVILAPEDLEMIALFIEEEKNKLTHIYFSSDPTVQRGDVRIECDSMLVNCALARELESVRTHVLGVK